jgi:hypothetical protein
MSDTTLILPLLPVFKQQGHDHVYVVSCCGRVYVGVKAATTCRTCKQVPENHCVRTDGSPSPPAPQE